MKDAIENVSLGLGELVESIQRYRAATAAHQKAIVAMDTAREELDSVISKFRKALDSAAPIIQDLLTFTASQTPRPISNPNAQRIAEAEINARNLRAILANERTSDEK